MRLLLLLLLCAQAILGPPVDKNPKKGNETSEDWNLGVEYQNYLKEVVTILESDPEFRKKLENAKPDEIKDGTIARELEYLSHGVRTRLDEVKRQELERLRHLAQKQHEMNNGIDRKHIKIPQHVEMKHPSFEIQDLEKLIKQTTNDLEEADNQRREEFKKYEMEKKFEKEHRLNAINDTQARKDMQEEMEKLEAKHRVHEKMNHPMTKDQLEEVWENQDHMDAKDWDPKTFFAMHDLDGNGQWDENEVKALFKKELDKTYDPNNPEDDMKEREEEMERMREHVFKESDKDKNMMISYEEFLAETEREEFEKDPGWDSLDDEEFYTDEEFNRFETDREQQIKQMMESGQLPPNYNYPNIPGMPPPGYAPGGYGYAPPLPGAPIPGVDPRGIPMHGSVPGQPAYPQFVPGQAPPPQQFPGQQQFAGQPQFAGQQQFAGQPQQQQQFAGQPQQQQQFAGQPQQQQQFAGQPQQQQQFAGQPQQQQQFGQPQQFAAQPIQGQQQYQPQQQQPLQGQQQPLQGQQQPLQGKQQPLQGQQQPLPGQQPRQGQPPMQGQPPQARQQAQQGQQQPLQGQQPQRQQQQQKP